MSDKMREEFENSVCDLFELKKDWNEELECYAYPKTDNYFVMFKLGWQASRAALCVEFTKPRETDSSGLPCYDEYWREDVEDMLNAAGVRYK